MTKFDIAVEYVLKNEGGLNTDKTDRGGLTNFGISEKFIKSLNDSDQLPSPSLIFYIIKKELDIKFYIKTLVIEQAKWIYKKYFWLPIYEKINNQDICNYIFDMHVQHGEHKAIELVQRALNSCYNTRCLKIDGKFGDMTLSVLNKNIKKDIICSGYDRENHYGLEKLKSCLIAIRESLFRCIVAHDKTQENKLETWLNRCYR